jgi:hypothetical protein
LAATNDDMDKIMREESVVFLMYHPRYFTPFISKVYDCLLPNAIIFLEHFQTKIPEITCGQKHLNQLDVHKLKQSKIIIFDYFSKPVNCIAEALYKNGNKIIFVQHGSISEVETEIDLKLKKLFLARFKYRMQIFLSILLFSVGLRRIKSVFSLNRMLKQEILSEVYLFINDDKRFFSKTRAQVYSCTLGDDKYFTLNQKSGSMFVSQPLVEENIVEYRKYKSLFKKIVKRYNITSYLVHPRDKIFSEFAEKLGLKLYKLKSETRMEFDEIVGHYSSLLYSISGFIIHRVSHENGELIETINTKKDVSRPLFFETLETNIRRSEVDR